MSESAASAFTFANNGEAVGDRVIPSLERVTGKHVDELRAIDSAYYPLNFIGDRRSQVRSERLDYLDAFAGAHADLKRRQNLDIINDLLKF